MNFTLVFFGLITWLPLCVWISCLVHWAVGGDIDVVSMVVGVATALVLGVVAIKPPIEILSPIACVTAYLTVFLYPILNNVAQRQSEKKMNLEEVEDAYRAIGQSPTNPFAKFKLAKALYRNGLIGHAVAIADTSLPDIPRRVAEEEYRMLAKWKRVGVPPQTMEPIVCVDCQTLCPPGWTHCRNCGSQFLLQRLRGQMLPGGMARKLVAIWGSAVILLVSLPLATSLTTGPAIAISMIALLLVGAILFFSFKPRLERIA